MKQIKDLKITTKEGFSVKNLERFPSMEYGEEGGIQADLYYKGDKIMTVFDEGNGGCANCYTTELYSTKMGEIKSAALKFLQRCDKNWDKYDFLKNKTAKDIDDDDFLGIVVIIEDKYEIYKTVNKSFKDGFKAVAVLTNDFKRAYLQYRVSDVTMDEVKLHMFEKDLIQQYPSVEIIYDIKELTNL